MKWVKENIEAFGGNPNSITLCGESAGSVSVSAHTLSEESWPYFDRVILQSGNMLAYWAISSEVCDCLYDCFSFTVNLCSNHGAIKFFVKNFINSELHKLLKRIENFCVGVASKTKIR